MELSILKAAGNDLSRLRGLPMVSKFKSTLRQDDSNPWLTACNVDVNAFLHRSNVEPIFSWQRIQRQKVFIRDAGPLISHSSKPLTYP